MKRHRRGKTKECRERIMAGKLQRRRIARRRIANLANRRTADLRIHRFQYRNITRYCTLDIAERNISRRWNSEEGKPNKRLPALSRTEERSEGIPSGKRQTGSNIITAIANPLSNASRVFEYDRLVFYGQGEARASAPAIFLSPVCHGPSSPPPAAA